MAEGGDGAELGTVVATWDGPTTANFSFVLNSNSVRKGQFVKVETEDGLLIGSVSDITRANRYFERAESVAEYEKNGSRLMESFPTTDWEYTVANCRALGLYNKENLLVRNVFPPAPGSKVLPVEEARLKSLLGFEENGLALGKLAAHDVEARIGLNRLLQKHFAILGMSGCGKSYLTGVVIEELLDRKREHGRPAVIVVDVHGEYVGFADRNGGYGDRATVFDGRKIRIGMSGVSPRVLAEFVPDASPVAKRELARIMERLHREKREARELYGLDDLVNRVDSDATLKDNVKGPLLGMLYALKGLRLFGKATFPASKDLARPGRLAVIDLSGIDDARRKQVIVAYFGRRLFKQRKKERIPPFLLMVEESHNFAREKARGSEFFAKPVIELIAREGRKFGASLCLISQRPVQLSTTALSQANTHIIMRVTNPYDIKHIGESCEGIDQGMLGSITTLRTGEAMIVGEAANFPAFVNVRKRRGARSARGGSMESIAKKFEDAMESKKKDVEAFL
ncbi:MAG: ATP-binding protein [Candidatus ainarchaeum sp.]|nr:ATP-binding protein [Candidatus ainarchaeum sp.]